MAIGERIKRIRNIRKLTQKELGLAVGFDDNTADVRIAQYESNTRTPKEEMLRKIAEALDVNFYSIYEPTLYAAADVMYTLFELDEHYPIRLNEIIDDSDTDFTEKHIAVNFHTHLLDRFLTEWKQRKKDLADGVISNDEYMEWKLNWPRTCDDGGKFEPTKQWRKPPDITS